MNEIRPEMSGQNADGDPVPAIYSHCEKVFNAMRDAAQIVVVDDSKTKMAVWEGFLTRLIQGDLNLAVPYYSSIKSHLTRMGCIRQLRRGGGNSPSQWEIIKPPSLELYESAVASKSTAAKRRTQQEQQILDLTRRVGVLESDMRTLIGTLNSRADVDTDEPRVRSA